MVRILQCYRFIIRSLVQVWCFIILPSGKHDTTDPYHPVISTPEMQLLLFFRISPGQWEQTIISHKSTSVTCQVPWCDGFRWGKFRWMLNSLNCGRCSGDTHRAPWLYFSPNYHFNVFSHFFCGDLHFCDFDYYSRKFIHKKYQPCISFCFLFSFCVKVSTPLLPKCKDIFWTFNKYICAEQILNF